MQVNCSKLEMKIKILQRFFEMKLRLSSNEECTETSFDSYKQILNYLSHPAGAEWGGLQNNYILKVYIGFKQLQLF
jgi:hypothetical protein